MRNTLPLTHCLSPLASQQGHDLTQLAMAEMSFNQKLADLQAWLRETRSHKSTIAGVSQ